MDVSTSCVALCCVASWLWHVTYQGMLIPRRSSPTMFTTSAAFWTSHSSSMPDQQFAHVFLPICFHSGVSCMM